MHVIMLTCDIFKWGLIFNGFKLWILCYFLFIIYLYIIFEKLKNLINYQSLELHQFNGRSGLAFAYNKKSGNDNIIYQFRRLI